MTLQQLEYALILSKYGNFSKAAKVLGITQPALSLQIQNLEANVGLIIFDRATKPIQPTYGGRIFLEKAQMLVTEASQLKNIAIELGQEFKGELKLGIIPTVAPYLVPLFIDVINIKYPKLRLHISEALTEEILEGLNSGRFHGGIIATPIQTRFAIKSEPLFYEQFMLYVSRDHEFTSREEIDIQEISFKELWMLKEGNCFRDQVDNLCHLARDYDHQSVFTYESNSIEGLLRIVNHRGGVTFLPELTTMHLPAEDEIMIKRIKNSNKVREISLVSLPNEVRKKLLDKVGQVIRDNIPKKMLKKGDATRLDINLSFK
ncbi:MAG TPA: hydrogen peroxide-inducible genes activator [Saprospiraceae bacterium]|nr:hydrogen peroxide-inducible genes activator [Saprospiraceae bacterium]